jgi:hypothetical protein
LVHPYIPAMAWLFRKIFWLALFLCATFAFVVLFEHGTTNYLENARVEFQKLKQFIGSKIERPEDQSDKVGQ